MSKIGIEQLIASHVMWCGRKEISVSICVWWGHILDQRVAALTELAANIVDELVKVLEMKRGHAQPSVDCGRRPFSSFKLQHQIDALLHLAGRRLLRQLAISVSHQPLRGQICT